MRGLVLAEIEYLARRSGGSDGTDHADAVPASVGWSFELLAFRLQNRAHPGANLTPDDVRFNDLSPGRCGQFPYRDRGRQNVRAEVAVVVVVQRVRERSIGQCGERRGGTNIRPDYGRGRLTTQRIDVSGCDSADREVQGSQAHAERVENQQSRAVSNVTRHVVDGCASDEFGDTASGTSLVVHCAPRVI